MIESMRGLIGAKGEDGLQGIPGTSGDHGKAGIDGAMGESGRDGARGPAGPQGLKGDRGEAIKGDTGEEGQDGRSISKVSIHGVNLIITFDDGSFVNVGRVVGLTGPRGVAGKTGGVFGDTTNNTTNITEEVLSPADSANLAAISPAIEQLISNQDDQLKELRLELKLIKTHLSLMTDEELKETDIEEL